MNQGALKCLLSFMKSMKSWEIEFCTAQDEADEKDLDLTPIRNDYALRLKEILDMYSLDCGLNRERLVDLGSTIPVTYDPDRDEVDAESESLAVFIVKQATGFKSQFRFSMINKDQSWLIQKKERLGGSGKWLASSL
ncbi:NTF2 fold immunity protein [Pseudomonas alliivorans]|nr:NTF2 fold immunity protein [Pseudomonas alliivorans]